MSEAKPGWYFFVGPSCSQEITFKEAPSPEEEERPSVSGVQLVCPSCGTEHTYRPADVDRCLIEECPMTCPNCQRPLIEIDYYGELLIGCIDCNRWGRPGDKTLIMELLEDDLQALRDARKSHQ